MRTQRTTAVLSAIALSAAALIALPGSHTAPAHATPTTNHDAKKPAALGPADATMRVVEFKITADTNRRTDPSSPTQLPADVTAALTHFTLDHVGAIFTTPHSSTAAINATTPNDLAAWHHVVVANANQAEAVATALRNQNSVVTAYVVPEISEATISTPPTPRTATRTTSGNYEAQQTYLRSAAEGGIDAYSAWKVPGGTGKNVTVTDVERGWALHHEDLSKLANAPLTMDNLIKDHDHGTAVAGVIWGDRNDFGVTGIAHDAAAQVSPVTTTDHHQSVAAAIWRAAENSTAGDVIVLEQQIVGCGGDVAPVEVVPSIHEAIKASVERGIHVVEAAGNGQQNLDDDCYGGAEFPKGYGPSGAIMVGAGGACNTDPRYPMWFTNYGTRLDIQGWGECVVTTGYGDLAGDTPSNEYAGGFSGTSSASAVIGGVVASLSSVAEEHNKPLPPAQMRAVLKKTGVAQTGDKKIGPLPDLRSAINALGIATPSTPGTPTPTPTDKPSDFYKNMTSVKIQDYRTATSTITSAYPGAQKVLLELDLKHTCAQHLKIDITTPDGVRNTVKRASYTNRCATWDGPKSDTFAMRSASEGDWSVHISDHQRGHHGTLNGWSLSFS